MTRDEALLVLNERMKWLTERIKAKATIGWETQWDERERDALAIVLRESSVKAK